MLARFVDMVSRSATGKRLLWRSWYQFLAARYRDPAWTFMNYGYRSADDPAPQLDPATEPERSCAQLYDVVARGAPIRGREVLEVGCGRGGGAAYVARAFEPRRMVAVDLSPRAIALCRSRFVQPNLAFQVGDAEKLPFGDASFDVVVNVESSHCYGHFGLFLREVRRVLHPNGHFLYADFRPAEQLATWRGDLLAAGFAIAVERDLRPGVVAAFDVEDAAKRAYIHQIIDRPLQGIFRQFAAVQGSVLNDAFRRGEFGYRAFALTPS